MTRATNRAFHAVLLAGGGGTRFWPLSRENRPKQFLRLSGDDSLLVESWKRLRRLVPPSRAWVAAPKSLAEPIARMLPELRRDRLIVEPTPKDTAAAATLSTLAVAAVDPDAVVGFFPSDHVIRKPEAFERTVESAVAAASGEPVLICLGVVPDRPATGFGYLRCRTKPRGLGAVDVEKFVEKPDAATARKFLRSGRYLWNAGMFVWRAETFVDEMTRAAPEILRAVSRHRSGKAGAWGAIDRISLDYALMERAGQVRAVPLRAGWDDIGSWDAWARVCGKFASLGAEPVLVSSPGSTVVSFRRTVALVGIENAVVVDSDDAVLVVARERAEEVRRVVAELKRRGRKDLL